MTPDIIFEDNHVIVAVKPAGVLSQADGSDAPDILTIIKDYIKLRDNKPGNVFLGLIHRLDRNVEGVMVFAKTSQAYGFFDGICDGSTVTFGATSRLDI